MVNVNDNFKKILYSLIIEMLWLEIMYEMTLFHKEKGGMICMFKQSRPLLDDEFLDELAKEINDLYGDTAKESKDPTLEIE